MKKISWIIPFLIITAVSVLSIKNYLKPSSEEKEIPGNPGWFEQFYEMKKGQDGLIDWDLYNQVRQEVMDLRSVRSGALFSNVTECGPNNVGGRTRAMLVDYADSSRLFAGGVSGGLWVSPDRGANWSPVDDNMANLSITSITQSPFDHNIFYYSGGEMAGNSAGIPGNGVYKSTDGGQSFSLLASSGNNFNYTWQIEHSLNDTNEVFVGTGSLGLWQTPDAGATWVNVLTGREITDIVVFPDGSIIVAAHHDGLYYSPSGDVGTFTEISTAGLPVSNFNRVVLARCRTNANYVYAMYENNTGDAIHSFWQSTDQGVTWTEKINPSVDGISLPYPWYTMMMFVDDNSPQTVIVGGVDIAISFNGGGGWIQGWDSHADYHIGFSDPMNPDYYYIGNDGGVHRYDVNYFGSTSYELNNGYNVTQFYAGCFFPDSVRFWGGTQDNGTQSGKPTTQAQNHIFGGDGAFCAVNQQTSFEGYVSWQDGHIQKTTNAHASYPFFYPAMNEMDGDANGDVDDGTWFINPFEMNELDGQQLYFPTQNRLWRTINGADNWEILTSPISNLYAVGVSYELDPIIYTGGVNKFYRIPSGIFSGPGDQVNLSSTIPGTVGGGFMSCISVSPKNEGTLFITYSTVSNNPRVYKVVNANTTPVWSSIQGDLPAGLGVNSIDVSPYHEDYLVIGTDFGVFTSSNGGTNWVLETDIPNVSVHQVKIRNSDCKAFIFTHGRGIWTADIPTTGMNVEDEMANQYKVYPTVTSGNIQIESIVADYRIEVYNVSGQKVLSAQNQAFINISGNANGMYLVNIFEGNKKVYTRKVFLYR
jgi:hypothetical protein